MSKRFRTQPSPEVSRELRDAFSKDTPPGEAMKESYTIMVDVEPHEDGGWVGTSPVYPDVAAYCDTKEEAICEVADAVIALTFFDKTDGEA